MSSAYIGICMYEADIPRQWGILVGIHLSVSTLVFDCVGHTSHTALCDSIEITAKGKRKSFKYRELLSQFFLIIKWTKLSKETLLLLITKRKRWIFLKLKLTQWEQHGVKVGTAHFLIPDILTGTCWKSLYLDSASTKWSFWKKNHLA